MFRKILFYLVVVTGVLVILASLLSLLHSGYWFIKLLDFPRLQLLLLALLCLGLLSSMANNRNLWYLSLAVGLAAAVFVQALFILPYTFLVEETVPDAVATENNNAVGLLIANVYQHNRNASGLLKIIEAADPDMVLAMETDRWWVYHLQSLKAEYPYTMLQPLNNTYGMALYSRFPLRNSRVRYLSNPKVPSFHTQVQLPSGRVFMFHGVHPVPPVPSQKLPDNIGEKEVELLKVGNMVTRNNLPDVVAGDYNDVPWSSNTQLFRAKGRLANVRLGRGLYNSFNAKAVLRRWPLDHYFVTEEFALQQLERLPEFGSDHFPMYARLVLQKP